jgi:dTDP-glucose 4,6-dehydratase
MILVTGGAGFIGSNFILRWLDAREESILCVDKLTYSGNRENLACSAGDPRLVFFRTGIEDSETVTRLLKEYSPRAVIHFAAESHVDRSILGPEAFIQTNVVGTFRLLESVRRYWGTLPGAEKERFRFVHVSTDEVYGSLASTDPPFHEGTPYAPNSPYSASKAGSDHLVRAYYHTYGLPTVTTNCSNNYGPFQFPEKLIPVIIRNALARRPLPLYGDGRQIRDWLYVGDHCDALVAVLERGRVGETYNVGGNSELSNLFVVERICSLLDNWAPRADGISYLEQRTFVKDRPGHDRRYAIDARKIAQELGWKPQETFDTGIGKTVRWYLDNHAWVERVASGEYRDWERANYEDRDNLPGPAIT